MSYAIHDCSVFMQRLESDHARLRSTLSALSQQIEQLGNVENHNAASNSGLLLALTHFREFLAAHFRDEEDGGCIEEAACRCPSISREVSQLQHQHKDILFRLDKLIQCLQHTHQLVEWRDFRELESLLLQHEECEERLVRHGFNMAEIV
jgi:iron-sulfur cluster repair protein YtfE (RIC family)